MTIAASFWLGFATGFFVLGAAIVIGLIVRAHFEQEEPMSNGDGGYDVGTEPRPFVDGQFARSTSFPDQSTNPRGKP